jgi:hypothetical protein
MSLPQIRYQVTCTRACAHPHLYLVFKGALPVAPL